MEKNDKEMLMVRTKNADSALGEQLVGVGSREQVCLKLRVKLQRLVVPLDAM